MKPFTYTYLCEFECLSVISKESDIASGLHTAEKIEKMAVPGIRGRCLVCKNRIRWFCVGCGFDMYGYAWLCRKDKQGRMRPCHRAQH